MSVTSFKANTTLTDPTGVVGIIRTISINQTQATWDTTAHDVGLEFQMSWFFADGTMTVTGIYDPDDASHIRMEAASASGAAGEYVILFKTGDSWTATLICTDFTLDGDYEAGWTFSATFQKVGNGVFGHV